MVSTVKLVDRSSCNEHCDDRYLLIDVKRIAQLHVWPTSATSAEIHNRDLFGIKVIYRYGYRNACPCKYILAIGSDTERDRRT